MHKITELRAGDFIDLDNYFREIIQEDYTNIENFYLLLLGRKVKSDIEIQEVMSEFINEMTEIKETYIWIFSPPQMPTSSEQPQPTIGDDYRNEFAQDYGLYTEMIYLMSRGVILDIEKIMQMKCIDFLFWGEYLLRKRFVENIK